MRRDLEAFSTPPRADGARAGGRVRSASMEDGVGAGVPGPDADRASSSPPPRPGLGGRAAPSTLPFNRRRCRPRRQLLESSRTRGRGGRTPSSRRRRPLPRAPLRAEGGNGGARRAPRWRRSPTPRSPLPSHGPPSRSDPAPGSTPSLRRRSRPDAASAPTATAPRPAPSRRAPVPRPRRSPTAARERPTPRPAPTAEIAVRPGRRIVIPPDVDEVAPVALTPEQQRACGGQVVGVSVVVGSDGALKSKRVISSVSPDCDALALDVLARYRFRPARDDRGSAAEGRFAFTVQF